MMTPEKKQEYTRRISQASRTGIIVITYEIALGYIKDAEDCLKADDRKGYEEELRRAEKCIEQLLLALDHKYAVSLNLMRIYNYVLECIRKASYKKDPAYLIEPKKIMTKLRGSFEEAARSDSSGSMMGGADEVYEGLTYNSKGQNCTNTMKPR